MAPSVDAATSKEIFTVETREASRNSISSTNQESRRAAPPPPLPPPARRTRGFLTAPAWLDRCLPPHRRYCGLRRRTLLIVTGVSFVLLLVMIIGLAVELTMRARYENSLFLPLPTDTRNFTGDLTYYEPGLGACGQTSDPDDPVVSVSHYLFDHEGQGLSDPNKNPLCGMKLRAVRFNEVLGMNCSIDLTVVDRCTGCEPTDIDVSRTAFSDLADPDDGRVDVTWAWLSSPDNMTEALNASAVARTQAGFLMMTVYPACVAYL